MKKDQSLMVNSQLSSPLSPIPPGYKQTEIGVIPEDWEVKHLYKLAEKIMVGIASAATHAYRDKGIVLLRNQNIKAGYLDDSDILHITPDYEASFKNKRLKSGDLLTARTGYPGTTCVIPACYESAQSFTTLITRPDSNSVNSTFLCCYINSESGQRFFEQNQIGGGQKNVNAGSLKQIPIPLPPTIAEQEAIAQALSDTDALLESLEQLLAKKRQIKQGAMQELLTGKRRSAGFDKVNGYKLTEIGTIPEDWNVRLAGELCKVNQGLQIAIEERLQQSSSKAKQYITIQYLNEGKKPEYIENYSASVCCTKDDVLMTRTGNTGIVVTNTEGVFHNNFFKINFDKKLLAKDYLVNFLQQPSTQRSILAKAGTSTIPDLNHNDFYSLPIVVPPLEEQEAIATILSDMDSEIASLETKLTKTRQLKQGMMHQLLTGRIRLI